MSAPFRKLKKALFLMDCSVLCRGCLADSGEMKDMFEWGLADFFAKFTNIQLKREILPVLLCTSCEERLLSCQNFMKQCQNTDETIANIRVMQDGANPQEYEEEEAIQDIQENMVLPIVYVKKVVFNIVAPDNVSKIYLPCMYCAEKYIKQKDLIIHLVKMHDIEKTYGIEAKYYCNVKSCRYFLNSGTDCHFLGRKNLNQHFIKVHKKKVLQCSHCKLGFPTESYYDRHMKICGHIFVCGVCSEEFKNNERLMVHLLKKHPEEHKEYKESKALKRKSFTNAVVSLPKTVKRSKNNSQSVTIESIETGETRESRKQLTVAKNKKCIRKR